MFSVGDSVVVTSNKRYKGTLKGMTGVVKKIYSTTIGVEITDRCNPASGYGYYFFTANEIKLNKEANNIMDSNIMTGNYVIANISFLEGTNTDKTYKYALYDDRIFTGDICVVKTAHHGLGIGVIKSIEPKTDEPITREVVCKADFRAYCERLERRERRTKLLSEMKKRSDELQEIMLYKTLAQSDPDMAELINELEMLDKED